MPRLTQKVPSYRLHKASGLAVVTLDGRDFYLGPHGTDASRAEYERLVGEWLTNGRRLPPSSGGPANITMNEMLAAFLRHAQTYYRDPAGDPTAELECMKLAMHRLRKLYAGTLAADFGPLALMAVQQSMIDDGCSRGYINRHTSRIKLIFKWAASRELIPTSVSTALANVEGLQAGRSDAREADPVRPVPDAHVEAIRPHVTRQVWGLVQLQRYTGARPGELVRMRPCDLDTTGRIWTYTPPTHKTAYRGHKRTIYLGPRAQQVVGPFLAGRPTDAFLFSPAEAEAERRTAQHERRTTPLSCGNRPGSNRKRSPKRRPHDQYDVASYRRAITRACDQASPPPEQLGKRPDETVAEWKARLTAEQKKQLDAWRKEHRWHPHQLRHSAATKLRKEFGIEAARIILGHRSPAITELYAELDHSKAADIISRVG